MFQIRKVNDLSGNNFFGVQVISLAGIKNSHAYYNCICPLCGSVYRTQGSNLKNGKSKSCGCDRSLNAAHARKNLNYVNNTILEFLDKKTYKNSKTGIPGVTFENGKYVARIYYQGKTHYLGRFLSLAEAAEARKAAEKIRKRKTST